MFCHCPSSCTSFWSVKNEKLPTYYGDQRRELQLYFYFIEQFLFQKVKYISFFETNFQFYIKQSMILLSKTIRFFKFDCCLSPRLFFNTHILMLFTVLYIPSMRFHFHFNVLTALFVCIF